MGKTDVRVLMSEGAREQLKFLAFMRNTTVDAVVLDLTNREIVNTPGFTQAFETAQAKLVRTKRKERKS